MAVKSCRNSFTMMSQRWLFLLLLTGILATPESVKALSSDAEQFIHIQADAAELDDTKGSSVYRGNVFIQQGSLEIKADEVEIVTNDQEVVQIIANTNADSKKLAHFEQLPDGSEDRVYADARKITYLVLEERLHLSGNATLKQTEDVLTGELVYYDMSRGIMSLKSRGQDDRIDVTINPRSK
jgi:lipopolysaccharide export system protein LptA